MDIDIDCCIDECQYTGMQKTVAVLPSCCAPVLQARLGKVAAAQLAEQLTLNQYRAGTVDFTAVITAQANSLASQQTALSILQSRLVASVDLIEALGGGWDTSQLPSRAQVETSAPAP